MRHRKRRRRIELEYGQIGPGIGFHVLRDEPPAIGKLDDRALSLFHDVVVGEDDS